MSFSSASTQRLRVLLYTCGSHTIGMGNVMRALAIAQAFEDSGKPVEMLFAVQEPGEAARHIASCGYPIETWDTSRTIHVDVVIVDVPHSDVRVFEERKASGTLTVCIDDPGPGRWAADVVFTMLYAPTAARPPGCATEEVGRFEYFPLRREFANLPKKRILETARRLLVVHGGSDAHGATARICRTLAQLDKPVDVDVVMGPAFRHESMLRELLQPDARFHLHRQPSMRSLMQEADLAISAAGVTALELAAVGVPMLLLVSHPREVQTAVVLEHHGVAVYLGQNTDVADQRLLAEAASLLGDPARRRALSGRAQAFIDGRGAQRVVEVILSHTDVSKRAVPVAAGAPSHRGPRRTSHPSQHQAAGR